MKLKSVYGNGYKFSDPLPANLLSQTQRVEDRKASLIIFDGGVGSGKTFSGIAAADFINDKPINLSYQYAMGGIDFEEKIAICMEKKSKVILYDEAGDFNRRGALTVFNQRLNRIFETYRAFEIIIVLILPCFAVLDKQLFLNKIPRLLIHTHNKKQGKYTSFKAYSLWRMFYLKHKMSKLIVDPQAYNLVGSNFRGCIKPLDPDRAAEVDKISFAGKEEIMKETKGDLKNRRDLAKIFKITPKACAERLIKAKIKPVKKIKCANYYDEKAFKFLKNYSGV